MTENPDPKAARYLQNILASGRNLLDLINDLLDLAKIEAGRMDVRSEPLSLNDLFEGLINLLKPLAEGKELSIVPSVATEVPIMQTDPSKLQQVLYNLLSNAIKFSPNGSRIELTAKMTGADYVRIAVKDHGPGIEPEKQEVIFEKFRQIDGSVTRQHSGTGLGLAISRELISLLGGTMGVDSVLGEGGDVLGDPPPADSAGPARCARKIGALVSGQGGNDGWNRVNRTFPLSPSPGTPGEGWGEGFLCFWGNTRSPCGWNADTNSACDRNLPIASRCRRHRRRPPQIPRRGRRSTSSATPISTPNGAGAIPRSSGNSCPTRSATTSPCSRNIPTTFSTGRAPIDIG